MQKGTFLFLHSLILLGGTASYLLLLFIIVSHHVFQEKTNLNKDHSLFHYVPFLFFFFLAFVQCCGTY